MFSLIFPHYKIGVSLARQKLKSFALSNLINRSRSSYIVLLPEVPEDVVESNPLLEESNIPKMSELTLDNCVMALGKKSLDHEAGVWAIEESVRGKIEDCTFEGIIHELEKLEDSLGTVWSIVKTLYTVRNEDIPTANYLQIHERARKANACKFQSRLVYEACKNIYKKANLTDIQKRVIQKYLLEYRLNGVGLSDEQCEQLRVILLDLERHKSNYKRNLKDSTESFSYRIIDKEVVKDFPEELLRDMSIGVSASSGPWAITLKPSIYERFMKICPHKDLRWNAWNAYNMRASKNTRTSRNNSNSVEEIRCCRNRQANLLGFKTFADMSMETKMAGTVENVINVISSLLPKVKSQQMEEINSLKEFAMENGFKGVFEEPDVPFWRKKQLESLMSETNTQYRTYFPFDYVWNQLLSLCSNLFDVNFEKASCPNSIQWHPSVQYYNVLDRDGKVISSFFLDPYKRKESKLGASTNSAWVMSLKKKSLFNSIPLISIIFNFPCPTETDPVSLLSLADIENLFKKFGLALQHLLTTVPYGQASGVTNIEWDAVDASQYFLLNWLYEEPIFEKLSKHYQTGEHLSSEAAKNLLSSRRHLVAYDLSRELFISHFDLRLYSEETFWLNILTEMWPLYFPFEMTKYQSFPCWFSPIISDTWAAAYYSHVWSRMLAADIFRAFKECEPREVSQVGIRYRDTFLSLGGGCHSAEVFRKFRGRDPMPEALLTILGIS